MTNIDLTWEQALTFAIALSGLIISLYNSWRMLIKDRAKLIVRHYFGIPFTQDGSFLGEPMPLVSVTNISLFPLYIKECGYVVEERVFGLFWREIRVQDKRYHSCDLQFLSQFPKKLESRQQQDFYLPQEVNNQQRSDKPHERPGRLYVSTQCGLIFFAKTKKVEIIRNTLKYLLLIAFGFFLRAVSY